jgi:hypothetical protein
VPMVFELHPRGRCRQGCLEQQITVRDRCKQKIMRKACWYKGHMCNMSFLGICSIALFIWELVQTYWVTHPHLNLRSSEGHNMGTMVFFPLVNERDA